MGLNSKCLCSQGCFLNNQNVTGTENAGSTPVRGTINTLEDVDENLSIAYHNILEAEEKKKEEKDNHHNYAFADQ